MASIEKKHNVWVAVWYVEGKRKKRSTGIHVSPTAADGAMTARQLRLLAQQAAEAMERIAKGEVTAQKAAEALLQMAGPQRCPKVSVYLQDFVRGHRGAEGSKSNRRAAFKDFLRLLPLVGEKTLAQVTKADVQDFIMAALDEVAGSTVDRKLADLTAAFNRAVAEGHIARNPFTGARVPKWATQATLEREPMTREDLQVIFSTFPGEWPEMVAVCLLLGGQRLGDVAGFRWEQVLFDQGLVKMTSGKTKKRMLKPLIAPLRSLLLRRKELLGNAGGPFVFPAAQFVCAAAGGKTNKLSLEFARLCRDAGISVRLEPECAGSRCHALTNKTFHSLRSTAVTFLLDCGTPAEMVRYIVGHDCAEIERKHYFKPSAEMQGLYLMQMGKVLGLPWG